MSTVSKAAKIGAGGLSAVTLGYLLSLFVTRTEFGKLEKQVADYRVDSPTAREFNDHRNTEANRIKTLEEENKLLMRKIEANEATLNVLRSIARKPYE